MTPDRDAIERGRRFEREGAEQLGLRLTPGSGNGFSERSDARGVLRVSFKSESRRSWADTRRQLVEAVELALGTGEIPALGIEDPSDGERLIAMRMADFAALLVQEAVVIREPGRAERLRVRASIPGMLRDEPVESRSAPESPFPLAQVRDPL